MKKYLFLIIIFFSFSVHARLTTKSDAKKYYIYSYDDAKVYVKRGKKKYVIRREDFRRKNIKVNEFVKIHDDGLKKVANFVK